MIPEKYDWLFDEPGPKMLLEGIRLYGTAEIVGKKHNPTILGWAKELGIEKLYTEDEIPWCGLAHAYVAHKAGKSLDPLKGWDLLRALQWERWGVGVNVPMLGDTLIFKRTGGGHVGLMIAESKDTYHCLGGNSSNRYQIVEIAKSRLHAVRRPQYISMPTNIRRVFMDSSGLVSTNEA